MSNGFKRSAKKHTQAERLLRLEKVSSKNYFDLRNIEKQMAELVKQGNAKRELGLGGKIKKFFFGEPKIKLPEGESTEEQIATLTQTTEE